MASLQLNLSHSLLPCQTSPATVERSRERSQRGLQEPRILCSTFESPRQEGDSSTCSDGQRGRNALGRRTALVATGLCACGLGISGGATPARAEYIAGARRGQVCPQCVGSGEVRCNLCGGTGKWVAAIQNGFEVLATCPQCEGRTKLKCTRCLGTGLGDTAGLLRGPAAKEGHLRVRADGSIQILDCDYFPATRGKQCLTAADPGEQIADNRITLDRAQRASRGSLYPRPDVPSD